MAAGGGERIVLLACGSFNPPTVMHLRMFELAKDYFRINKPGKNFSQGWQSGIKIGGFGFQILLRFFALRIRILIFIT